MPLTTKTSPAAHTSLAYVTAGALILVWSLVWLVWMLWYPVESATNYFLCAGTIMTGIALLIIGLSLGFLGRVAKMAEQPAEIATETHQDAAGNVTVSGPQPTVQTPAPVLQNPPVTQNPAVMAPANGTPQYSSRT